MRLVADTNTVISGLLWHGAPRRLLDAARAGKVSLFTSAVLLAELDDTLSRAKFAERLERAGATRRVLVQGYAMLAAVIKPAAIPPTVLADPDDDAVLACAIAAQAQAVASGDSHRLNLNMVAIIPLKEHQQLVSEREARFQILDDIHRRMPDLPAEEVEQDVTQAIAAVRRHP